MFQIVFSSFLTKINSSLSIGMCVLCVWVLLTLCGCATSEEEATAAARAGKKQMTTDPEKALEYFSQAILSDPKYAPAYSERSVIWVGRGLNELALLDINRAIELEPQNASHYDARARIYYFQKNYPLAIKDFQRAEKGKISTVASKTLEGICHSELKQYKQAIAIFDEILRTDSEDQDARYQRALAYYYVGDLEKAKQDYQAILKNDPTHFLSLMHLGMIAKQQGDLEMALDFLDESIERFSLLDKSFFQRGVVLAELNFPDKAIQDFNQSLSLNFKNVAALWNRGLVYLNQGNFELAAKDFDAALKFEPDNARVYQLQGLMYLRQKQEQEALKALNKAISLQPELSETWNTRGLLHLQAERFSASILDFSKAIELNPQDAGAYINRADAYAKNEMQLEAQQDLNTAAQLKEKLKK